MQETARAANFVQALVVGQCFEQRAMPSLEAQAAPFELRIKLSEIKLDLKIGGLPEYVLGPGDRAGARDLGAAVFSWTVVGGKPSLQ